MSCIQRLNRGPLGPGGLKIVSHRLLARLQSVPTPLWVKVRFGDTGVEMLRGEMYIIVLVTPRVTLSLRRAMTIVSRRLRVSPRRTASSLTPFPTLRKEAGLLSNSIRGRR